MKIKIIITLLSMNFSVLLPPTTGNSGASVVADGNTVTTYIAGRSFQTSGSNISYDKEQNIIRVYGERYRVYAVEKNYVAEINVSSLSYLADQIVNLYSTYTNPSGISKINYTITNGFTQDYSLSLQYEVTVGLASTVALGIEMHGVEGTTDMKMTTSYTYGGEKRYSLSYSTEISKSVELQLDQFPSDYYVNYGEVADILSGKVRTYVQEHWFFGVVISEDETNKDFQYLSNIRDSVILKDANTGEEYIYNN